MTPTQTGIAVGAVLVIVLATFNFGWFIIAAVFMAVGALVGRIVEGRLDVGELVSAIGGKRRSS